MRAKIACKSRRKGLTLVELLIAALLLAPLFLGTAMTFIKSIELSEAARHSSMALYACRDTFTAIENTPFVQVYTTFHNTTTAVPALNGTIAVSVNNNDPDLLVITLDASWNERGGRLMTLQMTTERYNS